MQRFRYQAKKTSGEIITGEVTATSVDDVTRQLLQQGLTIDSIEEVQGGSSTIISEDFLEVVEQVEEMTTSGIPLLVALRSFQEESLSKKISTVLNRICRQLEQGGTPADILRQEGQHLPAPVAALIDAGDSSNMASVLGEYLNQTRKRLELKKLIITGVFYPAVLLVATSCLFLFVLVYLAPQFKDLFQGFGMELPAMTMFVFWASDVSVYIVQHWVWFLFCLLAIVVLFFSLTVVFKLDRRWMSDVVPFIPVLGASLFYNALASFSHMMALLMENGVPFHQAIRISAEVTDDLPLIRQSKKLKHLFEQGSGFQDVRELLVGYPPEFLHVFRLMGQGDAMLEAMRGVGDIYTTQAKTQVDLISVFLGPLMVCLIGLSIGLLVIALFMPMLNLINGLS